MDDEQDRTQIIDQMLKDGDFYGAESFAQKVEDAWQKGESLAQVARAFAKANKTSDAHRVWADAIAAARAGENSGGIQDRLDSSSVLWEIAEDMALAGDVEVALEIAATIKSEKKRQRALQGINEIVAGGKGSFYKIHNHLPF